MSYRKAVALLLACVLVSGAAQCGDKRERVDPQSLISRALSEETLWTKGMPPTVMRAKLRIADGKGGWVRGEYAYFWVSPSQWREDIRFSDYQRLRVGTKDGYWQTSTLSYRPELIFQLDKLLRLETAFKLREKQTLGKVKTRNRDGVPENCADVKWKLGTERTLCLDAASGALASVDYPGASGRGYALFDISRIEYRDFHELSGKLVPYEIRGLHANTIVYILALTGITALTSPDPALFAQPAKAEFWTQCDNATGAQLVHQAMPVYPDKAKVNGEQGEIVFYAVIEDDGSVSHLTAIQEVAPDLAESAAAAVNLWRYKPATCGGKPIRMETSISVIFTLGQ